MDVTDVTLFAYPPNQRAVAYLWRVNERRGWVELIDLAEANKCYGSFIAVQWLRDKNVWFPDVMTDVWGPSDKCSSNVASS